MHENYIYLISLTHGLKNKSLKLFFQDRKIMFKYTLLIVFIISHSLSGITIPLKCDSNTQILYNGMCVSQQCIMQRLPRLDQFSVGGNLTFNTQSVTQLGQPDKYQVTILYPDSSIDQLISDPQCIDWRIYQTVGDNNNERKFIASPGSVPTWPIANYLYNTTTNMAQIVYYVTQNDLQDRNCSEINSATQTSWNCYFEFAFVINNQTQVSHFFDIVINFNRNLGGDGPTNNSNSNPLATVDIRKRQTVFVMECQEGDPKCQVTVTIASSLKFCSDILCQQTSVKPFQPLYVNQQFFMKHSIDSVDFQNGWTIQNVHILYNSDNLQLILTSDKLVQVTVDNGYNIYSLMVPIVSSNVLISASGTLTQLSSRILQQDGQNQVFAQQNTGLVQMPLGFQPVDYNISTYNSTQSDISNYGNFMCIGAFLWISSQL